jgi:diguanylate cyclase (GGDEF)-like protein
MREWRRETEMWNVSEKLGPKLLVLKERFVEALPQRFDDLSTALERWGSAAEPGLFEEVERRFHTIAGTAGTYGVVHVAALAAEGEETCAGRATTASPDDPAMLGYLRSLVESMRCAVTSAEPAEETSPTADPESTESPLPTALLVSGFVDSLTALASRLRGEGFSVVTTATLAAAASVVRRAMPDVVVTEIALPDGAGYDLIEAVRSAPRGTDTLAIVCGAPETFAGRLRLIRCTADATFADSSDTDLLMHTIRAARNDDANAAPRILCVEDDPDQSRYVEAILRGAGYCVSSIADPTSFESMLTTFRPDLIVMDIVLPDFTGVDLARYVREDVANATLPIVFLTGQRKIESRMRALGVGGDDYLTKPVAPELLLSVVAARLKRSCSLKALIDHDGLTGALTHSAFMRRAQTIASETRRRPEPVALVMLDLDYFKSVNDRYGHLAGDRVLSTFSSFLKRNLRAGDEVGRYGGEEFAMVLRNISVGEVQGLVARLVMDFGAIPQFAPDGSTFHVTFSAGVAMYESSGDLQVWKQRADEALYSAKHLGRARVEAA